MNINDLQPNSYKVVSNPTNINQLPPGSFSVENKTSQPANPQQQQAQNGTNLITNVANFLGMGSLGKFLGGKIAQALPKPKVVAPTNYQGTQQQFQSDFNKQQNQSIQKSLPSNKQVLGSALQTGADIATAGVGSGGSILAGLGIAGGAGALSGFGSALEQNKSMSDSAKQALATGLVSGLTYGALAGAGKLAQTALEKLPTKIYASVAKLEKESANVMMNDKMIGDVGKLTGLVKQETSRINKSISEKISQNNGQIDSMGFLMNTFNEIKGSFKGVDDAKIWKAIGAQDIAPLLQNENVDYVTADNIRQKLGQTINWTKDTPFLQQVRETMWKNLVNEIRPNTGTEADFAKLAPLVKAAKSLTNVAKKQDSKFGIGMYDLLAAGAGAAATGGNPIGATAAVGVRKLSESPTVKTGGAIAMQGLNEIIKKLPFDSAGNISRTALMNYAKGITQ